MAALYDRVKVATATTGTGTITLGAAVRSGTAGDFLTFSEIGVPDGTLVAYFIQDGANWASGQGVYTASGTALSRDANEKRWNGSAYSTAALNLSGSAVIYISARAEDVLGWRGSATLDFGAFPGSNEASVSFASTSINAQSFPRAFILASDTSADHTASDHRYAAMFIGLTVAPDPGVGGTIYARSPEKLTGEFTVRWQYN